MRRTKRDNIKICLTFSSKMRSATKATETQSEGSLHKHLLEGEKNPNDDNDSNNNNRKDSG